MSVIVQVGMMQNIHRNTISLDPPKTEMNNV